MVKAVPRRKLAPVAAVTLLLVLAGPLAEEHAAATTAEGVEMKAAINRSRRKAGRIRLRLNERLSAVAQNHAQAMAATGSLHHNPTLVKDLGSFSWRSLGENVGVGNSVASLHRAFMSSRPHRRNILRRSFRKVGVGTVFANGRLWVTVVFAG